ncbi:serine hydrolase [Streptomyces sp. NPDC003035]|uniref:serine hydrolase n=1 Tax=Streptomyces sp. NPDC003035 TaxID=3364676 RepID=UPI0036B9610E
MLAAAHPPAVDLGIALLVQAAMTMPFVVPRPPDLEPATWTAYGLTTLTVIPLIWRRRAPVAVLLAIMATSALYKLAVEGPGQPLPYTGLVIVYTIAALSPPWKRLTTGALLVVAVPVSVWLNTRSARELTFSLFVFAAAYVFGRLTDARQRATRVEAERAAARERARIAREMHDILSHAVSLMVVQAEAGPVAVRAAPERAEAAFDAISATGRDAMAQLRRMLGVLREGDEPGTPDAPRAPQPDLRNLPELVELLIERVTGDTYEEQVAARVLRPLGLRDTYVPGTDPRIRGPHNHGYQTMTLDDGTTGLRDVSVWGTTDGWAAGDIVSTTADLERFTRALFQGRVVRGPLLEEMFTLPKVADFRSGDPAAYSVGLSMKKLGGREVWGKTGGRWGYNAAIASTRDGARTLVYSVNATDAKGQDMNEVALRLMPATYGTPSE